MTVYVDNMFHPFKPPHRPGIVYLMSHMFALDVDELHDMARRIGVARKWFQCPPHASWNHYDIAKGQRAQAIKLGAVAIEYRDLPAKLRELGLDRRAALKEAEGR